MRKILCATLALAIFACHSDSTSPTVSLTGTYTLKSINGSPLPYTTSSGDRLTADVLTINANGTYTDVSQYTTTNGSSATDTESGTYTNNNGAVTFNDLTDNLTYQGSLSGSVLTEVVAGLTEVYQHQ
jgi:hypothetical protein